MDNEKDCIFTISKLVYSLVSEIEQFDKLIYSLVSEQEQFDNRDNGNNCPLIIYK